jgi:hypothetical protein
VSALLNSNRIVQLASAGDRTQRAWTHARKGKFWMHACGGKLVSSDACLQREARAFGRMPAVGSSCLRGTFSGTRGPTSMPPLHCCLSWWKLVEHLFHTLRYSMRHSRVEEVKNSSTPGPAHSLWITSLSRALLKVPSSTCRHISYITRGLVCRAAAAMGSFARAATSVSRASSVPCKAEARRQGSASNVVGHKFFYLHDHLHASCILGRTWEFEHCRQLWERAWLD